MMSVNEFSRLLVKADVSEKGQKWFPSWVGKYAVFRKKSRSVRLAVDRETVIEFL
jgi:hypothetical protein